jgi:hypothetical protein
MPEECVLPPIPLIPEDCGPVRRMGYAGLPAGTYDLTQYATRPANATAFDGLLVQMQQGVKAQADAAASTNGKAGLANAKGVFTVEDWQTNLKKITLHVSWSPQSQSDTGTYDKIIYLDKDSVYE